jgi:hypothetical protein
MGLFEALSLEGSVERDDDYRDDGRQGYQRRGDE